jgi:hypothetical protein
MNEDCCCGGGDSKDHRSRRVLTKEERLSKLKNYKEELEKELASVEENIEQLSK